MSHVVWSMHSTLGLCGVQDGEESENHRFDRGEGEDCGIDGGEDAVVEADGSTTCRRCMSTRYNKEISGIIFGTLESYRTSAKDSTEQHQETVNFVSGRRNQLY